MRNLARRGTCASAAGIDEDVAARAVLALLQGYLLQVLFDPPADPVRYADTCVLMLRSALGLGAADVWTLPVPPRR